MRQAARCRKHPAALYECDYHSAQQFQLHHRLIIPIPLRFCKGGGRGLLGVRSHGLYAVLSSWKPGTAFMFPAGARRAEEAFPHLPFPAVIPRFPGPEGSVRRKDLVPLKFLSTPQADRPRAKGAGAVSVCRNGRKLR